MRLKTDNWYYFEIMRDRSYLYVSHEDEHSYYVTHYFKKDGGKISKDKGHSYIKKVSRSLNSYHIISERELIKEIW